MKITAMMNCHFSRFFLFFDHTPKNSNVSVLFLFFLFFVFTKLLKTNQLFCTRSVLSVTDVVTVLVLCLYVRHKNSNITNTIDLNENVK